MIEKKKKYKLTDFRYQLPKKYIAQKPRPKRDSAKMMVLNREERSIKHSSCLLYTSPSPRDRTRSRMPSSA